MAFDMDILTQVSTAQVLGTGATLSTYSIPLGAAVKNDEIDFVANVSSVSGTTPTLAIEVIGADDAGLTSNVVSLGRVDPVIATGMAPKNFYVDGELLDKMRLESFGPTLSQRGAPAHVHEQAPMP